MRTAAIIIDAGSNAYFMIIPGERYSYIYIAELESLSLQRIWHERPEHERLKVPVGVNGSPTGGQHFLTDEDEVFLSQRDVAKSL